MALAKREKQLAAVTAGLLTLVAGHFLYGVWQGPLTTLEKRRTQLRTEVETKTRQVNKGLAAQKRIKELGLRSLPARLDRAQSLYVDWLLAQANEAGLKGTKVESGPPRRLGEVNHLLSFGLQARASLRHLTRFLYRFHAAGHLHQIRSMSIVPAEKSEELEVQIAIEALVLQAADRQDKLSQASSRRLAFASSSEYRLIDERNLFAAYKQIPPPRSESKPPPAPPPFDHSKYAELTGIVEVGKQLEAWVRVRTTDKKLELHEGESFEVGTLRGKVVRIGLREIEIEVDGRRGRVPIGGRLADAVYKP